MQRRGNEVSLGTNSFNPLILVGLAWLQAFHNDYNYWTNSIANLMQLSWTRFVQAGDMSIDVIISRFEEIINSLLTRGVSARETLIDVSSVILRIFAGALQSTINSWRASELYEMMYGEHDTSEASGASSEASNPSIASDDASEASSKASEASKAASEASKASSQEKTKAEEEEKATVKAKEEAQSEAEAKTEAEVDNTMD